MKYALTAVFTKPAIFEVVKQSVRMLRIQKLNMFWIFRACAQLVRRRSKLAGFVKTAVYGSVRL